MQDEDQDGFGSGSLSHNNMTVKDAVCKFRDNLPQDGLSKKEKDSGRELAEKTLIEDLDEIFSEDLEARRQAENGEGLRWLEIGGCYKVDLRIQYNAGIVVLTTGYREI